MHKQQYFLFRGRSPVKIFQFPKNIVHQNCTSKENYVLAKHDHPVDEKHAKQTIDSNISKTIQQFFLFFEKVWNNCLVSSEITDIKNCTCNENYIKKQQSDSNEKSNCNCRI